MIRPLRVNLPHDVADWPRSRAMALATRCARELLAKTGDHLAAEPEWFFEPRNGRENGPLTVAVATVVLESKLDVVKRAQALMAAMDHTPSCSQCTDYAEVDARRFADHIGVTEACRRLGLSDRGYYRHKIVHPYLNAGAS